MDKKLNQKFLFIINPFSGSYNKFYYHNLIKSFILEYKIIYTYSPEKIEPALIKFKDYLPVIIGGDGTILNALPKMIKYNKSFAVFPGGTSNVFCKELQISSDFKKYLFKLHFEPENYKIDVIKADETYFLSMCGIGWDAEVVKSIDYKGKKFLKITKYIFKGIEKALTKKYKDIKIVVEGEEKFYKEIIIGNIKKYAGNFNLFLKSKNNDGKMDIICFKKWNFLFAAGIVIAVIFNKLKLFQKYYDYYQTSNCKIIYPNPQTPVQIDGDYYPAQLQNFKVLKQYINIIK